MNCRHADNVCCIDLTGTQQNIKKSLELTSVRELTHMHFAKQQTRTVQELAVLP
jgi:hypothetical protein